MRVVPSAQLVEPVECTKIGGEFEFFKAKIFQSKNFNCSNMSQFVTLVAR